jgi:hypothetical protein
MILVPIYRIFFDLLIDQHATEYFNLVLIGAKCDESKREVTTEQGIVCIF